MGTLDDISTERVFVCCSGTFRLERTIALGRPEAQIIGNDVSLYSCAIGRWLTDKPVEYRFTGPLEPLEEALTGATNKRRAAGVLLALELTQFGKGKPNPYKQAHWRHLMADLEGRLTAAEAKLESAFGGMTLDGFYAGDWLKHIDRAIEEGATIATFPPFYKGGSEALFKWLDQHVEWDRPAYDVFDPKNLQAVVDKITGSGVDYLLIANQRLDRPDPRFLFEAQNRTKHWGYVGAGQSKLRRSKAPGKPFNYAPLDLAKLTKDTKVELVRTDGSRALYIRSIYLKKSIAPAPALHNYLVYLDGMLAGVLAYAPSKFHVRPDDIYLMSDVSVSREAKVSKLIARLAANRTLLRDMAARSLTPIGYVVTTAFSDHPVSMKYRGIWDLLSRKEAEPPATGFQLQYGAEARDETPQQAFAWWWSTYVNQEARPDGNRRRRGGRP